VRFGRKRSKAGAGRLCEKASLDVRHEVGSRATQSASGVDVREVARKEVVGFSLYTEPEDGFSSGKGQRPA